MNSKQQKAITMGIVYIAFMIISSFSVAIPVRAESKQLDMEKAVSLGLENDSDLSKLTLEKMKIENQLKKAKILLVDFRKKDIEAKYSLPINYDLPITDDNNKVLEEILKIPQLQASLLDMDKRIADLKRKAVMNIRKQYLSVYSYQVDITRLKTEILDDKAAYEKLAGKFKTGQVTAEKLKDAEKSLKALENEYQTAIKEFGKNRNNLDALINFKLDDSYIFETSFVDVDLTEAVLKEIVGAVTKNDQDINTAMIDSNRCRLGTAILLQDAKQQFGSASEPIEKLLNTKNKIDIKTLTIEYEKVYAQFEAKYSEAYYIPFGMFSIRLDKKWAGDMLAGVTSFDNSDKELVFMAIENEIAAKNLDKVKNEQLKAMENLIADLTESRKACQDSEKAVQTALKDYEKALEKSKLGKITSEELLAAKKAVNQAICQSVSNMFEYNKMLYTMDYEASGAISKYLGQYTMSLEDIKKGGTFSKAVKPAGIKEPETAVKKWYIKASNDSTKVVFNINTLPKGIAADEYEICNSKGSMIGKRCKLNEQIAVLPVAFDRSALLQLRLYKSGKLMGLAELDGFECGGDMVVVPPPPEKTVTIN